MLETLRSYFESPKNRNLVYTAGGLVALLAGRKLTALGMFGKGLVGLEKAWREAHPDFDGGPLERWQAALEFYAETHKDAGNRKLHIIGIPFIVAGTAGLVLFPAYRPLWSASAIAFVGGWALNFVGHGVYEKKGPAFADDPLSFIAGPVWDFQQLFRKKNGASDGPAPTSGHNGNGSSTHAGA